MKIVWCLFVIFIHSMSTYASTSDLPRERGAALFTDYCSGCHTLRYMAHPQVSMPTTEAIKWFGKVPPDLSLITRERGARWLSKYLTSFYPDKHRPFGSNNHMLPNTAMPNVLAPLYAINPSASQETRDIVAYLVYVADPNQATRYKIGLFVVGFLCFFALLWGLFFAIEKNKLK